MLMSSIKWHTEEFTSPCEVDRFISSKEVKIMVIIDNELPSPLEVHRFISLDKKGYYAWPICYRPLLRYIDLYHAYGNHLQTSRNVSVPSRGE